MARETQTVHEYHCDLLTHLQHTIASVKKWRRWLDANEELAVVGLATAYLPLLKSQSDDELFDASVEFSEAYENVASVYGEKKANALCDRADALSHRLFRKTQHADNDNDPRDDERAEFREQETRALQVVGHESPRD